MAFHGIFRLFGKILELFEAFFMLFPVVLSC